jgi:hypothetical protein
MHYPLSQSELANMVGGSRKTINETLAAWSRDGIVERRGTRLVISDLDAVRTLAHGVGGRSPSSDKTSRQDD